MAISAARQWGENLKSVFDLFRQDLLQKIGAQAPETWEEEREFWKHINWTYLYWEKPDPIPRRTHKDIENNQGNNDSQLFSYNSWLIVFQIVLISFGILNFIKTMRKKE